MLSGSFRWEGDIVRLERALLQQQNSRYELQGEYVLPTVGIATAPPQKSLVEMVAMNEAGLPWAAGGRWRWQISVPGAEVEEMLPALQILAAASRVSPTSYTAAKEKFLEGIKQSARKLEKLTKQLEIFQERPDGDQEGAESSFAVDAETKGQSFSRDRISQNESREALKRSTASAGGGSKPTLLDLYGRWQGTVQAYGGGGGPTAMDFDVKGEEWAFGEYGMQRMVAAGNYHSVEGLEIDTLEMESGDASLSVAGNMLGPKQDAKFTLIDFPVSLLHKLFETTGSSGPSDSVVPATFGAAAGAKKGSLNPFAGKGGAAGEAAAGAAGGGGSTLNGNLYVRGRLRGSADAPQGDLNVRLLDGVLGSTALAKAEANAAVTAERRLAFDAQLQPATAPGHVKVVGSVPFHHSLEKLGPVAAVQSPGRAVAEKDREPEAIEIDAAVKDSGMVLISAISPQVHWESGSADIALQVRGSLQQPVADGVAHVNRALISCPWLAKPLSGLNATVRLQENTLHVDTLEGRVGRRGQLKVKGSLPITLIGAGADEDAASVQGIAVQAHGLEVRVRNGFNGTFDGALALAGSMTSPQVGGSMRFSKGTMYLVPPAAQERDPGSSDEEENAVLQWMNSVDLVGLAAPAYPGIPSVDSQLANNVWCRGLKINLGPELRAVYPFVLNFGIAGDVEITGPANDVANLKPAGVIQFDSGDINLVATQLSLNREHPNKAVFVPEQGLDPTIDVSLAGADLNALIQGKASGWQSNLVLTYGGNGPGGAEGAERLAPSEAARIFEGQLAESLLEEDGQLAFSNLAASTIATLLPKIETQGQLGKARWRLVSAPTIPGLLSLDPLTDPFRSLANLTLGTEVEVQFGKALQASVARKLKGSEMATHWTLLYHLNSKLRMRLHSSTTTDTRLLMEFSGEGRAVQWRDQ